MSTEGLVADSQDAYYESATVECQALIEVLEQLTDQKCKQLRQGGVAGQKVTQQLMLGYFAQGKNSPATIRALIQRLSEI